MSVTGQVLVLAMLMILGWAARKAGVLDDVAIGRFSNFVMKITLPALILVSLQKEFSVELLRQSGEVLLLSLAIYVAVFPIAFLYPKAIGASRKERGVHSYAVMFSNVGYMGYPLIEAVLGKEALFQLVIFNIPFTFFAFGFGAWFISRDGNGKLSLSWKILLDPCVLTTIVGFLFFLFSIRYPEPLGKVLKMTGDITTPLSMILIGAMLGKLDPRVVFGRWRTYVTACMRLVLVPAMTGGVLYLVGFRGHMISLPVLVLALPVAASTPIVASVYDADADSGSALVFVSTLACVATLPAVAALIVGL